MGYIGRSRSVRSQEAIDRGLKTLNQLSAWQKRAARAGKVKPREWHHTGKVFRHTYYYDLRDFKRLNPKDFPKMSRAKDPNVWYVLVIPKWTGGSHPRQVGAKVKVTNHLTDAICYDRRYHENGGYIKEFTIEEQAKQYAKRVGMKNRKDK